MALVLGSSALVAEQITHHFSSMKKIGVYILKGRRFYVGSTSDLERRLEQHKMGRTYTTRRIGPWELVRFIECSTLTEARILELKIKKSKNTSRWIQAPVASK